jgi:8-oxo-dGTP pyrophosphatase MutT (NUDIX family)
MKISTIVFPVRGNYIFLAKKKRKVGVGFLNGWGGKKKPGDVTIEDIARREFKEESGVTAQNLEKVAIVEFFEGSTLIFECHIFFCRKWQGELCETDEMGKPELYELDNIPFDRMMDADRKWLSVVCVGQKIRAQVYYNDGLTHLERFEWEIL